MKNMKRLIIIIVLFSAVSSQYVCAQEVPVHEFSAYTGFGLSSLRYQLLQGNRSGGFGGDIGVGYTWYRTNVRVTGTGRVFNERWGIFTGLGLGLYNAKSKLGKDEKINIENLIDSEGDRFNLRSTLSKYKETNRAMYLNIPAMAQFQIERYYVLGGFKFGIPLGGKYKSKDATLLNEAIYPTFGNYWISSPKTEGLGNFSDKKSDSKLKYGVTVMLALEGGVNWYINRHFSLYSGVYFDIGLNNVSKNKHLPFVEFDYKAADIPSRFSTNSMMSAFSEKVNIMAVGVKARLAYVK